MTFACSKGIVLSEQVLIISLTSLSRDSRIFIIISVIIIRNTLSLTLLTDPVNFRLAGVLYISIRHIEMKIRKKRYSNYFKSALR